MTKPAKPRTKTVRTYKKPIFMVTTTDPTTFDDDEDIGDHEFENVRLFSSPAAAEKAAAGSAQNSNVDFHVIEITGTTTFKAGWWGTKS